MIVLCAGLSACRVFPHAWPRARMYDVTESRVDDVIIVASNSSCAVNERATERATQNLCRLSRPPILR